ncbi:MAG: hypothetical protein LBR34_11010 [Prevotella sp.]|jgi:uncharacterized iron-regulated protein|nr:hypothetical protein [Prevotella sp.]
MKRLFNFAFYSMLGMIFSGALVSCSDSDPVDADAEKENELSAIVAQYVDKTVIATYTRLADSSIGLYEALAQLQESGGKTDANVVVAAEQWKSCREHWELSEAFLFGPVDIFGIDPHIDTWPLDEKSFKDELANQGHIDSMDDENGDIWVSENLGPSLLGFHGIEKILFENGRVKPAAVITANELIYAVAVAGDLRNQCVRLEASWRGFDDVSENKRKLLEDKELGYEISGSEWTYSEIMNNAGKAGSSYRSVTSAAAQILDGAITIADEVGNVKIGTAAAFGANEEDKNYIESPYSHNSLKDFTDNIQSIENAYLGGAYGVRDESLSGYIAKKNPAVDTKLKEAIAASYAAIAAIPAPFVQNFTSAEADAAVTVIGTNLVKALEDAKAVIYE